MSTHLTDGELRALLDQEGTDDQNSHLDGCPECQSRKSFLFDQGSGIATRLSFLSSKNESAPSVEQAWNRLSYRLLDQKEIPMFKRLFAYPVFRFGAVALLIMALILAFPGTRALAGELLNLFRVQQVTFVPVDFTGLEQLTGDGALGNKFTDLVSNSVGMTHKPGDPHLASGAAEASQQAGFTVRLPQGQNPSQIYVTDPAAFTMKVSLEKAQALLNEAGRSDLVLPRSIDGADISVKIPASVSVAFGTCPKPQAEGSGANKDGRIPGRRYPDCVILVEIPSPVVNAPAGVDVAQLAEIGLEFTGMSASEAAAFTDSVDWTSTLVIPIPKNAAINKQVPVDGVTGTLIQRPADDFPEYALLWVKDGIIYTISGLGSDSQHAFDLANSLK
jgi:hypothetical protein